MLLPLILSLFLINCQSAIVEKVSVSAITTSASQAILSSKEVSILQISSMQEKIDIQVLVCPTDAKQV